MTWWKQPIAGDICWCHFPLDENLEPGPKPRPALVIAVYAHHTPKQFRVAVVYGTSQKVDTLYSGEFLISPEDGDAYIQSGLSYPTKFNTKKSVVLPYNSCWFTVPPRPLHQQQPKLGFLHPGLVRRFHSAQNA